MVKLEDVLEATKPMGGRTQGAARAVEFDGFAFDSRRVQPGELFIAVRTAKADGHEYIADALKAGATGLLLEREVEAALLERFGATAVLVQDTRTALEAWGAYILRKYRPAVVAIAGSVGKTTTQHAIRAILHQGYEASPAVFANENYNDLFGLPIALSRLQITHQHAVVEVASDSFGEMARLASMIEPQIAVVTNAAPVHLQYLRTLENLAAEFGALVAAVPCDGLVVLNRDDPLAEKLADKSKGAVVRYSAIDASAEYFAERVEVLEDGGVRFTLRSPDGAREMSVPLPGRHHVYTALAAAAVCGRMGFGLDEIAMGLAHLRPLAGRLNPLAGRNGITLLDDSFSASPLSMRAALDALGERTGVQRIAVLGDMHGLGALEGVEHRAAGAYAVSRVDYLVSRGDKAAWIAEAAREAGAPAGRVFSTYGNDDATTVVSRIARAGDIVLVKGSEEARLEKVVEGLLAEPSAAASALVRQDAGWKKRVALHRERPTWLEIDLGAIARNVRRAKEIVGAEVGLMAVLKADAYGHGAARIAQTALLHGASMLGTACLSEAVGLRERGIAAPVLVLGYTPPWQARDLVARDIAATVFSTEVVRQLSRAASLQGSPARVHVKVDTGMGRLGLLPEEVAAFVEEVRRLPNVAIEGIFTHFATADAADQSYARQQLNRFLEVLDEVAALGVQPPYVHAANSAGLLAIPEARFNLVRLGIALYGLNPSPEVRCPDDFQPALAFKTQVAQVKHLDAGSSISYGATYRTERPSTIAVLPVGYGDGFRRSPRNAGSVLVRGRRAPILGVVCMDMCMIDVTEIPGVRQGDEVVLIGEQGDDCITVEEVAAKLGTINYEVVTEILPRVPREVF